MLSKAGKDYSVTTVQAVFNRVFLGLTEFTLYVALNNNDKLMSNVITPFRRHVSFELHIVYSSSVPPKITGIHLAYLQPQNIIINSKRFEPIFLLARKQYLVTGLITGFTKIKKQVNIVYFISWKDLLD